LARLIVKCKYYSKDAVKHKSNYMKYMATREGAVINPENVELDRASGIEEDKSNYIEYIAKRQGAQKEVGREHGLFSYSGYDINLENVMETVAAHNAPVWNCIISLQRDDARMYGFESIDAWKDLIRSHVDDIARNFKIDPDNLEWYAAFHDESYHPHVHMIIFARDGLQGHLTKRGLEDFKSELANDIFSAEMMPIFRLKTTERQGVKERAREELRKALHDAQGKPIESSGIAQKMIDLAGHLQRINGKKQYGYLNKNVKREVDSIVEELSNLEPIAGTYKKWQECQRKLMGFYKDDAVSDLPLVKNPEFKSIKNMIIREADMLGKVNQLENSVGISFNVHKSAAMMVARLGKALENIFKGLESKLPATANKPIIESKTKQAEREKRIALGEREDGDEPETVQGMSMNM